MPLMDNLKRGVDVAKFKADQLMRVNRVQGEISNLRRDIQGVRENIVNAVVQLHKQNALAHPELEETCAVIDLLEAQIAEKEAQIAAIKAEVPPQAPAPTQPPAMPPAPTGPVSVCPNCRASVPTGAAFCVNCGKPFFRPAVTAAATGPVIEPPAPVSPAPIPPGNACPNCGFNLPAEVTTCTNCGAPLQRPDSALPTSNAASSVATDDPAIEGLLDCPHCGVEIQPEAMFCVSCGRSIVTPEPESVPASTVSASPIVVAAPAEARAAPQPLQEDDEISATLSPATVTQWYAWTQQPASRPASSDKVRQWLKIIKGGPTEDRLEAVERFRASKPREAVPELLKLSGGLTSDPEQRMAAIMALGAIGDASAVSGLLHLKWVTGSLDTAVCCALAQIGNVAAVPYWKDKLTIQPDFAMRAFAAAGLGRSGQPEAISILVERLPQVGGALTDAARLLDGNLHGDVKAGPFLLRATGSGTATWMHRGVFFSRVASAAIGAAMARKTLLKNSCALVDWHLDLSAVMSAPADIGKMWLFHLWLSVLSHLAAQCGIDVLLDSRAKCKSSAQKLIVEIAALRTRPDGANALAALEHSLQAKDYCERILAYEGWIMLARAGQPAAIQRVSAGLKDSDTRVRTAVGSAIVLDAMDELLPDALALAQDASTDVRASMLLPIARLASLGHEGALSAIEQLAQQDADKEVREMAITIRGRLSP